MQIETKLFTPDLKTDCLILPIYSSKQQSLITTEFNKNNGNVIDELIDSQDLTGKYGEIKWLYNLNPNTKRILTIGVGTLDNLTGTGFIKLLDLVTQQLTGKQFTTVVNGLLDIQLNEDSVNDSKNKQNIRSGDWLLSQIVLTTAKYNNPVKNYQEKPKSKLDIKNYYICSANDKLNYTSYKELISNNLVLANAIKISKDLANMPPNICNPAYFAEESTNLANKYSNLKCTIFSHEQLEKMGMGAFVSVSQGSNHPGCMIVLEYNGTTNTSEQPYVLIGKGITFDTGGYTLKPPKSMLGMKYDMSGAASVFATMQAIAELKLPLKVIGILACAENMIGHKSTRPNDIVTSLKGKTIEINNTDAEGRLVLCDALTYSEKFNPKVVIDIATLTGAAVVALGYQYTAAYTNDQKLAQDLVAASNKTHDLVWPMPLCKDYNDLMSNPLADLQNSSSMPVAGSITAACFLHNFIPANASWAHLDIAGSATVNSDHTESTGRPVPLLVNYLMAQV